jgi:hypothetical protein
MSRVKERDRQVMAMMDAGRSRPEIAAVFGVTPSLIGMIAAKFGRSFTQQADVPTRIERYTKKGDGCWLWTGCLDNRGYAKLRVDGRSERVSRLLVELSTGTKPPRNLSVCHSCDNPPCVNPAHLFVGTQSDNGRDMVKKGRCGAARITPEVATRIRERAVGTRRMDKIIAAEFGVSRDIVRRIRVGDSWSVLHG